MVKTRPDSRLYALIHPNMGKWGGESMRQSTIIWECYKKNREKNIYLFEKSQ